VLAVSARAPETAKNQSTGVQKATISNAAAAIHKHSEMQQLQE